MISKHPHNSITSSMTFHSFFSIQKAGMYSDGIKRYAEKNDIVDKVKESKTPKLICDLVPR